MKKVLLTATVWGFTTLCFTATAQDEKPEVKERKELKEKKELKERKETQEIVIRKKGDKDTKITVEIKGDKVTINGKPISEFKDGDITINKRDIKIWDGEHNFTFAPNDMEVFFNGPMKGKFATGATRAFLGVTTGAENDGNEDNKPAGATITNVSKGSAAEKAGLKEGDVITKINDKKVEDPESLSDVVGDFKPKDEVTVYYKREGKEKSTKAVLGETKSSGAMAYSFTGPEGKMRSITIPRTPRMPAMPNMNWNNDAINGLGNLDEMEALGNIFPRQQKLGLKIQDTEEGDGVKVLDTDKDSPAEKAGLKKDDTVIEIGGKKISNTDDAREQLMENAEKSTYNIKAKRNGSEMSFDIKIPKKLKTANL
ncbi:PDZ domain-containing protein [Ferruginibacter sp.]|nr:PDZ domain-containing protein [Ferruginibacter sp.]